MNPQKNHRDGEPILRFESEFLRVELAPGVGGRIVSLVCKSTGHEFLWRNAALKLQRLPPGSEYDPNFYGGIDELLPNDIPETIHGVDCPDHGELWTLPLEWEWTGGTVRLEGLLPRFGLRYERVMSLRADGPWIDLEYCLSNPTAQPRTFLWKLHAALAIAAGDIIESPARQAQVADPAWSRFKTVAPFRWPQCEGITANVVPPKGQETDFFYLFDLEAGGMGWRRPGAGLRFSYEFDERVFRYAWLFASYGGFNGHYTAILEPCTAMPIAVNEAARKRQCTILGPGESLRTKVRIYAGPE